MQWSAFYGVLAFFLSAFLALAMALSFKAMKKRYSRRSPFAARQVGHVPGQQLVARLTDHQIEMVLAVALMYMALPLMFTAWASSHIDWEALRPGFVEAVYAASATFVFGYGFWSYMRHTVARDKARDGLLAERVTGMQLNRLIAEGCTVLHDVPCEGFNIDHVVIAPRGVYAVETKSFRKPRHASDDRRDPSHQVNFDGVLLRFPHFATRKPLDQADQQSQWLRRYLREALKADVPVTPALALPGWYINQTEEVWRNSSVKVFTPMGDGANFMAKELPRLDPSTRALIATALAQRFPVVAD